MLEIYFLGLCLLMKNGQEGRTVVMPDISAPMNITTPRGMTSVEPHVTYIAAASGDVRSCPDCVIRTIAGSEEYHLELDGDTVTISGLTGGYSEDESYESVVPHMKNVCPAFRVRVPASASTFAIRNGRLRPTTTGEVKQSILAVDTAAGTNVVITAKRDGVSRTMTLNPLLPGTKPSRITFSNRYANHLAPDTPALAENHWLAFYTLAASPVVCDLPRNDDGQIETTIACSNAGYP